MLRGHTGFFVLNRHSVIIVDKRSRNKSDVKHELEYFKEKGIHIKILDIPTTLTDFPTEQM